MKGRGGFDISQQFKWGVVLYLCISRKINFNFFFLKK